MALGLAKPVYWSEGHVTVDDRDAAPLSARMYPDHQRTVGCAVRRDPRIEQVDAVIARY